MSTTQYVSCDRRRFFCYSKKFLSLNCKNYLKKINLVSQFFPSKESKEGGSRSNFFLKLKMTSYSIVDRTVLWFGENAALDWCISSNFSDTLLFIFYFWRKWSSERRNFHVLMKKKTTKTFNTLNFFSKSGNWKMKKYIYFTWFFSQFHFFCLLVKLHMLFYLQLVIFWKLTRS